MTASTAVATSAPVAPLSIAQGYSSIVGTDLETRKRVFRAVSAAERLADHLNKPITLVDILVQPVQGENDKTGEVEEYHRITLIDDKGVAYSAGSKGLFNSVEILLAIMGAPSAAEPFVVTAVERKAPLGKYFALELV